MGMIVVVAVSVFPRRVMRMGMAGGMGMGVHCYQDYSTSLPARTHPEVSSGYWKL